MKLEEYQFELEQLGYTVGEAMDGVLFVEGFGTSSYFSIDDIDTLDEMIDPALHDHRVKEWQDPPGLPEPTEDPAMQKLKERVEELEIEMGKEPPQE